MAEKVAIVAFRAETGCFAHALLNAVDMHEKGFDVKLIIEGASVKTFVEQSRPGADLAALFDRVANAGVLDVVCQACAHQMGVLEEVRQADWPLANAMAGHPPLARYVRDGYQVITF